MLYTAKGRYIRAHLALNVTPDNGIRVDVSRKLLNTRPESRDLQRSPVAFARIYHRRNRGIRKITIRCVCTGRRCPEEALTDEKLRLCCCDGKYSSGGLVYDAPSELGAQVAIRNRNNLFRSRLYFNSLCIDAISLLLQGYYPKWEKFRCKRIRAHPSQYFDSTFDLNIPFVVQFEFSSFY